MEDFIGNALPNTTPPKSFVTLSQIPPLLFNDYNTNPSTLISIVSKDATSDSSGYYKVKLLIGSGMIGTYILSIDFGTSTSFPFKLKTKMYGTSITMLWYPIWPEIKSRLFASRTCPNNFNATIADCAPNCAGLKIAVHAQVLGSNNFVSTGYGISSKVNLTQKVQDYSTWIAWDNIRVGTADATGLVNFKTNCFNIQDMS